jgi:chaperonin GroES
MTVRPLQDRVLIRREDDETATATGILLGSAAERTNRGTVVAVGPGLPRPNGSIQPMTVKEGDRVLFGPYAGSSSIKVDGETLLVMHEYELLAVIPD